MAFIPRVAASLFRFLQGLKQEFSEKGQNLAIFLGVRQKTPGIKSRFSDHRVHIIQNQYLGNFLSKFTKVPT